MNSVKQIMVLLLFLQFFFALINSYTTVIPHRNFFLPFSIYILSKFEYISNCLVLLDGGLK